MKNLKNTGIVILVLAAAGIVLALKQEKSPGPSPSPEATTEATTRLEAVTALEAVHPRLLELGADKCVPCKMMAPILEDLRATYAGQLQVDFTDVWKYPDAGETYAIRIIPTQIFFGSDGKELFRHEGFFAKEDILTKWQELGYEFP